MGLVAEVVGGRSEASRAAHTHPGGGGAGLCSYSKGLVGGLGAGGTGEFDRCCQLRRPGSARHDGGLRRPRHSEVSTGSGGAQHTE